MSRERQLNSLVDIAIKNRDDRAVVLGKLQTKLTQDKHQLQMLKKYREDYRCRKSTLDNAKYHSVELQNDLKYLNSVTDAIVHQQAKIETLINEVEKYKGEWREYAKYVEQLAKFRADAISRKVILKNKQEQQVSDEYSTAMFNRRQKDLIG